MVRPDFRDFRGSSVIIFSTDHLSHSAKGSTWKEHKYIRKENGRYIYPKDGSSILKEKIIENGLKRLLEEGWDPGAIEAIRNEGLTKEELNEMWEFTNTVKLDDDENWLKTLKDFSKETSMTNTEQKKVNEEIAKTKEKINKRKEKIRGGGLTKEELNEMWEFTNTIKEKDDENWLKTLVDYGKEAKLTKSEQKVLNDEIGKVREKVKDLYHSERMAAIVKKYK